MRNEAVISMVSDIGGTPTRMDSHNGYGRKALSDRQTTGLVHLFLPPALQDDYITRAGPLLGTLGDHVNVTHNADSYVNIGGTDELGAGRRVCKHHAECIGRATGIHCVAFGPILLCVAS